jgi:hypothetical protein
MPQVMNVNRNVCAQCGAVMPPAALVCPGCGHQHPPPYAVAPAAFAPATSGAYRSLSGLSTAVVILLGVNLLNTLYSLALEWRGYGMMGQLANGAHVDEGLRTSLGGLMEMAGNLEIGLTVITAIVFLTWVYRAHKNLDSLRVGALEYSHGWAVGWFFVPIMNIVRPKQVLDEIWEGSEAPGNSMITGVWWACWILSGVLSRVAGAMATANAEPSSFVTMFQMLMVDSLLVLGSGAAAITIVIAIQKGQAAKAARLSRPAYQ